jgi:hypothetical protein
MVSSRKPSLRGSLSLGSPQQGRGLLFGEVSFGRRPFIKGHVMWRWCGFSGLILSLIGILLLFYFGMPGRVAYPHGVPILTEGSPPDELWMDALYMRLGYLGLFLTILGTLLQLPGAWPREDANGTRKSFR